MNGSNGDWESDGRTLAVCPTDLAKLHASLGFDVAEREDALKAALEDVGLPELAAFHEKQASLLESDPTAHIGVRNPRRLPRQSAAAAPETVATPPKRPTLTKLEALPATPPKQPITRPAGGRKGHSPEPPPRAAGPRRPSAGLQGAGAAAASRKMANAREKTLSVCEELAALEGGASDTTTPEKPPTPPLVNAREKTLSVSEEMAALKAKASDTTAPEKPPTPPLPPVAGRVGGSAGSRAATPELLPPLSARGATPESIGGASDATVPTASLTRTKLVGFDSTVKASDATAPKKHSVAEEIDAKWKEFEAAAPKKLNGYDEMDFKWKEFQARFNEVNRRLVENLAQHLNAAGAAQQEARQKEKVTSLRNLQRNAKKTA